MADFAAYGLDTEKLSTDPSKKQKEWWCLWCNGGVKQGLYLCFQNWCICPDCVMDIRDSARTQQLIPKIDTWCFKCNQKGKPGFSTHFTLGTTIYICPDCIEWAHELLFKNEP